MEMHFENALIYLSNLAMSSPQIEKVRYHSKVVVLNK